MRFSVILPAVAVAMLALILMSAANAASGCHTYNAVSTISNGDGSNTFLLQSDNQPGNAAASASYSVDDPGVTSTVGGSSPGWNLGLGQQTQRTVYLDFSKLSPVPPVASNSYNASISSDCRTANGSKVQFLSITPGSAQTSCSLSIQFHYNGSLYKLAMDPAGVGPQGAPPTGAAMVACNSADKNGCNSWTITPYAGSSNAGVADLLEQQPNGLVTVVGSYSGFSFRVDVQR